MKPKQLLYLLLLSFHSVCIAQKNQISLGPALMYYSDKYSHYNSFGPDLSFTHMVSPNVGITADAGIYLHKENGKDANQSWTQKSDIYNYTAGITYYPLKSTPSSFSFYIHALAGLATYKSKLETSNNESVTTKDNSFTYNIGGGGDYNLTKNVAIGLQAAYTPSHFFKSSQDNFRIAALVSFKFPVHARKKNESGTGINQIARDSGGIFAITAPNIDGHPPLLKPDKSDLEDNPKHVTDPNCKGVDTFDYQNESKKDETGVLIIKNNGNCPIHVLVLQLLERPGMKKEGNKEGDTKEKNAEEGKEKAGKEKVKKLFDYDVEKLQGSDIYHFKIPKGSWIRVIIRCNGAKGPCDFTRYFSATIESTTVYKTNQDVPRLTIDPPTHIDSIPIYDPMGNRCISKDFVLHKITNRDAKETITIFFKAVSECQCYFEVYASETKTPRDPKPLTGGKLGELPKDESDKIAKPAKNKNPTDASEDNEQVIPPGKTIYIIGRCPVQLQKEGPCSGSVKVGIIVTKK